MSVNLAKPIGYRTLIRTNRKFRYLWLGQVVSNLGDWFMVVMADGGEK